MSNDSLQRMRESFTLIRQIPAWEPLRYQTVEKANYFTDCTLCSPMTMTACKAPNDSIFLRI